MRQNKGFTLIELLVVISIIGILSVLLMANLSGMRERTRDVERKQDLRQVKSGLELYYTVWKEYPANDSDRRIVGCNDPPVACDWGKPWPRGENVFMKILPNDPLETAGNRYYYQRTGADSYILKTTLENGSDKEIKSSQEKCGTGTGNDYLVCQD